MRVRVSFELNISVAQWRAEYGTDDTPEEIAQMVQNEVRDTVTLHYRDLGVLREAKNNAE